MAENAVILANGWVVTCDTARRAGRLHIVVRDGRIQELGGVLDVLTTMYPSASVVDVSNHLIIPGFVNAHYHTESFLLQELTAGKPLSLWRGDRHLREKSRALAEAGNADHLHILSRISCLAHLKSGSTTVAQSPPPADRGGLEIIMHEAASTGIRSRFVLQTWEQIHSVRDNEKLRKNVLVGLGREDDYTVYSFENFVRVSRELEVPLAGHVAEQRDDAEIVRRNFSKPVTALYKDFGALQPSTLLMHMNHGSRQDADLAAAAGVSIVLSAASTARKQCGYPFLRALSARLPDCCIGTDWGNVDMLEEMKFLRNLPLLFHSMPEFSAAALLRMATIGGAEALGIDGTTGSIEVGKSADLTAFSLTDIRQTPAEEDWTMENYADLLLRSLSADAISHVMVNGRFAVRDGALAGLDEPGEIELFRKTRAALLGSAGRRMAGQAVFGQPPKPKTYPFAPDKRNAEEPEENFVEGFTVTGKEGQERTGVDQPAASDQPSRRESTPPAEPPKTTKQVRRVFGEDDDV